jgi:hypothetical protein
MARYWIYDCGHRDIRDPWGTGPDETMCGLCDECRKARVGQEIEFVRYGRPVTRSRNHRDGQIEEGTSVYELVDGKPRYTGWYFGIVQRPAYSGRAIIVGWGSDGEPLVRILSVRRSKQYDTKD